MKAQLSHARTHQRKRRALIVGPGSSASESSHAHTMEAMSIYACEDQTVRFNREYARREYLISYEEIGPPLAPRRTLFIEPYRLNSAQLSCPSLSTEIMSTPPSARGSLPLEMVGLGGACT